ncbi:MAG: TMEM165/GDT1 family protein [Infirmifilum sp.]|uniref:TMEM165/GDT1 family protein n=1 Tax=Infirmifilum TaxID=2856573 RepID=UPI003C72E977
MPKILVCLSTLTILPWIMHIISLIFFFNFGLTVADEALQTLLRTSILVMLAELGDKTMIATATLALFNNPLHVLIVSILGYLTANAAPVVVACSVYYFLEEARLLLKLLSGLLFFLIGLHMYRSKNHKLESKGKGLTFTTVFLSEIGDKTQLATIASAAGAENPILPLLGGVIGYMAANILGVIALRQLARKINLTTLHKISGIVFMLVGLLTVFLLMLSL